MGHRGRTAQARTGDDEPWTRASFVDEVVALQRQRQLTSSAEGAVQVFDRSPVCTHALAHYLRLPVSPSLASELDRIVAERVYETQVLFVRNLGCCARTSARSISFKDSLEFEDLG